MSKGCFLLIFENSNLKKNTKKNHSLNYFQSLNDFQENKALEVGR